MMCGAAPTAFRVTVACTCILVIALALGGATRLSGAGGSAQLVNAPRAHARGQSVSPSFEGWYANADGTFSLVFGYFNRNYDEHLDIPIGPDNKLEPGPADRGQPTYFLPRRQTGVFAVVVPPDFGERELTWSLTAHGETIAIPGHLRQDFQIDALREVTSGNTPPVLRFEADGASAQGPRGMTTTMVASVSEPAVVSVWTHDDGLGRTRETAPGGLRWSKYRGSGTVTFDDAEAAVEASGRSETRVTFSDPGAYMLRVLVWDETGGQRAVMASGFFCCWTNGFVRVDVQ